MLAFYLSLMPHWDTLIRAGVNLLCLVKIRRLDNAVSVTPIYRVASAAFVSWAILHHDVSRDPCILRLDC